VNSRIFLFIFIFTPILIASLNSCHSASEKRVPAAHLPPEKKSPGKIVFDKEIHNFGTLKEGEIVSFSFIFRNMGGSPFKVIKVEKSCGCLELHYAKNDIAPGEISTVEVVLNTEGEWGNLIREAIVETSAGEKKELQMGAYIENKQFNNNLNTEK